MDATVEVSCKKWVSNPIREYLQMKEKLSELFQYSECFKPYKGVSSNERI